MSYDGNMIKKGTIAIIAEGEYDPVKKAILVALENITPQQMDFAMATGREANVDYYDVLEAQGLAKVLPPHELMLSDYAPIVSFDEGDDRGLSASKKRHLANVLSDAA